MFGQTYYHGTIRRFVVFFGSLFADIYINRTDSNNDVVESMRVPIMYGPVEKFLARVEADPDLTKPVAIDLPRMSFALTSMMYDGDRKLETTRKIYLKNNDQKISYIYNPVPFNFFFTLSVMVKNAEDGTKILEQILPYFTPDWTATLNLVPEIGETKDIPVVFNTINTEDIYEGDFTKRKAIVWNLNFTLKGYLYGPLNSVGLIKQVFVNFYIPTTNTAAEGVGNSTLQEHIYIQPGMDANGNPTSNVSISIPPDEINLTDDWEYIVQIINDATK